MFATYLIGLREGLEATLVVSILVAFLVKSQRRDRLPQVWAGVGLAVALSVLFGWLIEYTSTSLLSRSEDRELFEAITSVAAVVFVTWMIFWMRRAARSIAGELRGKLTEALAVGSLAVAGMAFLAVVREGLETALIFYSAAQGAAGDSGPLLALIGGIVTAVVLGVLLYASALRINLGKFFTWTGALLILVAAGILKYGVHDFQEAGVLPGLNDLAFDITSTLDPTTWYAALLAGMFNVTPAPTVLETIAWVAYAVPVLLLFLRPARRKPAPTATTTTVTERGADTGTEAEAEAEATPQRA
ncbi:iron uptake transporter permease EfeU [Micromonospora parathelypteridis]|uniref:High-affinity iron transporter n=1 Tax=Micromonospora parathelypteridis TaxID=1839617 RepID=A0A840W363_9ACTN|nr:iron uptake transporter permease EfeU [Micromonospora parathelypteridis]MBB5479230.1 high-affinity iron transporter [Micromonospora parathelypteridis]GGO02349.1 iron transporter [Micromonospora parathelypteridis]